MTDVPTYKGKPLTEFSDWELSACVKEFEDAEQARKDASEHPKFVDKKSKKYVGEFPPINPKYLEMKNAILKEIESRKNVLPKK